MALGHSVARRGGRFLAPLLRPARGEVWGTRKRDGLPSEIRCREFPPPDGGRLATPNDGKP